MSRRRSGVGVALVLACAGWSVGADTLQAQFPQDPFTSGAGVVVEGYRFEGVAADVVEGIVLGTAPIDARARLGSSVELGVRSAYARAILFLPGGEELTQEGFTDTEVRLTAAPMGGGLTLSVIGYLPTGSSTHGPEEAAVAGLIASDVLPFRISHWGRGGGVALHGAAARRFGAVGAGLAASWRFSGEYEPLLGGVTYQPGNELRVRGALDVDLGSASRFSVAGTWYDYSDDRLAGENLYRSGDRIEGYASLAFPMGRRSAGALYGGLLHRETGTFLDPGAPTGPAQDLLLAGLRTRVALGSVRWVQSVDSRFFQAEDGVGEGWILGTEAAFEIPTGPLRLTPRVGGRVGRLDVRGTGIMSRLWGVVAGVSLRAGR